jgi:hypothetical protein
MAAAMKEVIGAAAGLSTFTLESARDLVQYMVRRGQMTQDEADRLIRDAEDAWSKKHKGKKPPPRLEKPVIKQVLKPVPYTLPRTFSSGPIVPPKKAVPPAAHKPVKAVAKAAGKPAAKPTAKPAAKKPAKKAPAKKPVAKKAAKPAAKKVASKKPAPKK